MGYVGFRKIDVKVGGTQTENEINYVYNTVFEILGSFDASGNTKVFRRDQPVMLGTFTPEDSFKQITGLTGESRSSRVFSSHLIKKERRVIPEKSRLLLILFFGSLLIRLAVISQMSAHDILFSLPLRKDEMTNVDQARLFLEEGPAAGTPWWKPPDIQPFWQPSAAALTISVRWVRESPHHGRGPSK